MKPTAGLGEFTGIENNYMEYIFPSATAASVDLRKIPADYISLLVPTAHMADKSPPSKKEKSENSRNHSLLPVGVMLNLTRTSLIIHFLVILQVNIFFKPIGART